MVNTLGWPSLRALQHDAIAPVLEGSDALLLAPTAGGETEAAIFPLLTAMESGQWAAPSVIYVCPLKALLNNLEPRLSQYTSWLGRRCAVWHGDTTAAQRQRILRDPPDVLLTTPESLEAMLISLRVEHARFFAHLRAVVVDEVHAFAGGRPRMAPAGRVGTARPTAAPNRSCVTSSSAASSTPTSVCCSSVPRLNAVSGTVTSAV